MLRTLALGLAEQGISMPISEARHSRVELCEKRALLAAAVAQAGPRALLKAGRAVRHPLRTMATRENSTPVQNTTNPVMRVRSQRGNLGAKYDDSPGQNLKPLRRQFRTKYDGRKRRNTQVAKVW